MAGSSGDQIAYSYLTDTPAWLGFFDATVIAFCFVRLALAATDPLLEPAKLSPPFLIASTRALIFARALWLASRPVSATAIRRHMELFAAIHAAIAFVWVTLGVMFLAAAWYASDEELAKLTRQRVLKFSALFLLSCLFVMALGYWMPSPSLHETPTALAMWLGLLLGVVGLLYYVAAKVKLPLVGLLTVWISVSALLGWDDHHTIRTDSRVPGAAPAGSAFRNWLAERRGASTSKFPVVIIVSEGGGIRAAIMTTTVLDELRIRVPELRQHVFAIVGVSGGSVGAAAYAAAIHQNRPPVPATVIEADAAAGGWQASLYNDMLSPALRSLMSTELFSHLIPRPLVDLSSHDRIRALEYAWEANWKQTTNTRIDDLSFSDLGLSTATNQPALVLLTTSTKTGERMAVSHLTFPLNPDIGAGVSIRTLADEMPGNDVPLSTAAFMSARFPLVSPPARLPGDGEAKRYVDGGYFENSGVSTVMDILHLLQNEAIHKADFLVIRIENGEVKEQKPEVQRFPFVELRQPLDALLLASDARAMRATSELDERVQDSLNCKAIDSGCIRIRQAVFRLHPDPGKPELPLGWFITGPARAEIAHQVASDNESAFAEVADVVEEHP